MHNSSADKSSSPAANIDNYMAPGLRMPMTDYYLSKFADPNSSASLDRPAGADYIKQYGNEEGENQIMLMAQRQLAQRQRDIAHTLNNSKQHENMQSIGSINGFAQQVSLVDRLTPPVQLERQRIISEQRTLKEGGAHYGVPLNRDVSKKSAAFGQTASLGQQSQPESRVSRHQESTSSPVNPQMQESYIINGEQLEQELA